MPSKEKIQGCYWAFALGDCMGMPIEFNQIDMIRERYGKHGIQEPKSWAIWTDDTEMTFAVTRALLNLGLAKDILKLDDEIIGQAFGKEFITWFDNMGHAPGMTCKKEVFSLRSRGYEKWREVGNNDSKGCGTAMRASSLGIWYNDAITPELDKGKGIFHDNLAKISQIQSEITHGHKAATAASLASAYAVILALNDVKPNEMINPIENYCNHIHPDFAEALKRLQKSLSMRENGEFINDIDALHYIGKGWVGDEAFAMALYAAIRSPNDLKKCLRIAVNHSGDSDSVGCIAGSIIGSLNGIAIVPKHWIDRLAEKKRMDQLIVQVFSKLI